MVCLLAAAVWGWGAKSAAPVEVRPVSHPQVLEPIPTGGVVALSSGRTYHLAGDLASGPTRPLVIVLGGLFLTSTKTELAVAGSPGSIAATAGVAFNGFSAGQNLTVVYADSVHGSWNAGGCCGFPAAHQVDDLGYLTNIVSDASRRVPVDHRRVYLVGFSIGGMLAEQAACTRPDLFAATVSVAGPLIASCSRAPKILHIVGMRDTTVPFAGGYSSYVHYVFPAVSTVRAGVLAQHPGATYDVLQLPTLGHKWPTQAGNSYSTLNIGDWLLQH
jgi:predicted esterase